jgi:subtilisin family serine protease
MKAENMKACPIRVARSCRDEHTTRAIGLRSAKRFVLSAAVACVLPLAAMSSGVHAANGIDDKAAASDFRISASALQALEAGVNNNALKKRSATSALLREATPGKLSPMVKSIVEARGPSERTTVTVHFRDTTAMPKSVGESAMGRIEYVSPLRELAHMSVTPNELVALTKNDAVAVVRPFIPEATGHFTGSVLSQGDALLRASQARSQFGVTGKGTSVCVISDGVTTIAAAQATKDLPPQVEVCPQSPGSGDEGTAMLEIVHDLAPGANLAFCSARGGLFDAILWSATKANGNKGCDVIVDDFFDLTEPRFQISNESQLINEATRQLGITYVSSAGNFALNNYRLPFRDAAPAGGANAGIHDFGLAAGKPSSLGFPVLVAPQGRAAVFLQWSEAAGKARNDFVMIPALQGGAPINGAGSPFTVDLNTDLPQGGTGDPLEALVVTNNSDTVQAFFVLVKRKSGTDPVELSMLNNGNLGSQFAANFRTAEKSIYGHSGAEKTISVAAVDAANPGLTTIENFSSRGPVITYFDNAGNVRFGVQPKPDVTAVDGVSVTGAGGFPKTFFGTSASAPHVAAIAALVLDREAKADVRNILRFTSDARGAFDIWGSGIANAQRAVQFAPFFKQNSFANKSIDEKGDRALFAEEARENSRTLLESGTQQATPR